MPLLCGAQRPLHWVRLGTFVVGAFAVLCIVVSLGGLAFSQDEPSQDGHGLLPLDLQSGSYNTPGIPGSVGSIGKKSQLICLTWYR